MRNAKTILIQIASVLNFAQMGRTKFNMMENHVGTKLVDHEVIENNKGVIFIFDPD
jgi:hypothetical protein